MSYNNVYNSIQSAEEFDKKNNIGKRDADKSANSPSKDNSLGSSVQTINAQDTTGVNVQEDAKTKAKKFSFKNLSGDLELTPTRKNFDILVGSTIHIQGLGKYLSGFYHVDSRTVTINGSSAMSIKLHVTRTKFGDSLKGEAPLPEVQTVDLMGNTDVSGNSTNTSDGAVDSGTSNDTYQDGSPTSSSSGSSDDRVSYDY